MTSFREYQQARAEGLVPDHTVAELPTDAVRFQGERAGLVNAQFDNDFLDRLVADPEGLTRISHTEYMREAGSEGIELIMWLIMRGALNAKVEPVYRFYHVPASNTGYGLVVLENR